MSHAFVLGESEHVVWLARAANGYRLHVDGQEVPVQLLARGSHLHELTVHDDSKRVFIAQRGDEVHVHLDGEAHCLHYVDSLGRFAGSSRDEGEAVARAPMPGSVIAIAVAVGQTVERGQALVVIESMKMETTISAACDGSVQALHVELGQTFDRDAVLVTLERTA